MENMKSPVDLFVWTNDSSGGQGGGGVDPETQWKQCKLNESQKTDSRVELQTDPWKSGVTSVNWLPEHQTKCPD